MDASDSPVLLWFRQDLRLHDQAALAAAAATGRPVVPVFILDDDAPGRWRIGGASRWWLHGSLASLAAGLERLGSRLVLRRGDTVACLDALVRETGAVALHSGIAVEPWARSLSGRVSEAMGAAGIAVHWHRTVSLFDHDRVRTQTGKPYSVYTPFARACFGRGAPPPAPAPDALRPGPACASDALADWALLPTRPDWAGGLRAFWTPGEEGASARSLGFYDVRRNVPGTDDTSRLSPHLHFGEISPGDVWRACLHAAGPDGKPVETFLREVFWREFSIHLLWHHTDLPEMPLKPYFAAMPWRDDRDALHAWQRGRTGVPIIDAGMRQLWALGWVHNRVRLLVASFLVKNLLLPWQEGAAWFWDTLVDADLASNSASWQWIAGSGVDAAPYFRIFNPVLQGQKFDPDGAYVRHWVPELAGLPDTAIHAPWQASEAVLRRANVVPGESYPRPLVPLLKSRDRALAAYRSLDRRPPAL